jgi:hypothetical protein
MKRIKEIKREINAIKEKLFNSPTEEQGQLFTYWLGYLRALEWTQQKEK